MSRGTSSEESSSKSGFYRDLSLFTFTDLCETPNLTFSVMTKILP